MDIANRKNPKVFYPKRRQSFGLKRNFLSVVFSLNKNIFGHFAEADHIVKDLAFVAVVNDNPQASWLSRYVGTCSFNDFCGFGIW